MRILIQGDIGSKVLKCQNHRVISLVDLPLASPVDQKQVNGTSPFF